MIESVFRTASNYYLQVLLEERNFVVTEKKIPKYIIADIETFSDFDRKNSDEENSDEENSSEENSDEENSNAENLKNTTIAHMEKLIKILF